MKNRAATDQLLSDGESVGQVAVVSDGQAAELEIREQRLHVAHRRFAGGGVADVAGGDRTRQTADDLPVAEVVAYQTEGAVGMKALAVERDDAACLLATML